MALPSAPTMRILAPLAKRALATLTRAPPAAAGAQPRASSNAATAASLAVEQRLKSTTVTAEQQHQPHARWLSTNAHSLSPVTSSVESREQRFDRTIQEQAELKLATATESAEAESFPSTHLVEKAASSDEAVRATAELFTQTELGAAPWRATDDDTHAETRAGSDVPDVKHRGVGAIDEGVDGLREAGFMDDVEARDLATMEARDVRHDGLATPRAHPEGAGNIYAVDEQYKEFAVRILDMTESDFHEHRSPTSSDHDVTAARMSFTETERSVSYSTASVQALATSAATEAGPAVKEAPIGHFAPGLVGEPAVGGPVGVHPELVTVDAPSARRPTLASAAAAVARAAHRASSPSPQESTAHLGAHADEAIAAATAVSSGADADQWRPESACADPTHHHLGPHSHQHEALRALNRNPASPPPGAARHMHTTRFALTSRRAGTPEPHVAAAAAVAMAKLHRHPADTDARANFAPVLAWGGHQDGETAHVAASASQAVNASNVLARLARAEGAVQAAAALREVAGDSDQVWRRV